MLGLAVLSLAAGCESTDSTNIKTSGIYADMKVVANDSGSATVAIELKVGGASSLTFLRLGAGDELSVARGQEVMGTTESSILEVYTYRATFANAQANDAFVVDFERAEDVSALGSTATLPPGFDIVNPGPNDTISRADALTVTWDPIVTGGEVSLTVGGDCVGVTEFEVPDTGSHTFNVGDLDVVGQEQASCQGTLTIRRKASGSVSPTFGEGGVFTATQERQVAFTSMP
jgi:hypothetical protein